MSAGCDCGQPLHYTDPAGRRDVERLVEELGPEICVQVAGSAAAYLVPRHYLALHGVSAAALPGLAARYGWRQA